MVRVVTEQWRSNPLCKRLWRKIRPYALVFALIQVIVQGAAALSALFNAGGSFGSPSAPIAMGLMVGSGVLGMGVLVLFIMAPLVYSKWAYHTTFLNDEMLRMTPLSFRDRLMGILIPPVVAIAVVWVPSILVAAVQSVLSLAGLGVYPTGMPIESGPGALVVMGLCGIVNSILYAMGYMLLFATVVLRRLIQAPWGGAAPGRGKWYVVIPYLIAVGVQFAAGLVGLVPMMFVMFMAVIPAMGGPGAGAKGTTTPSIPAWANTAFAASFVFMVLVQILLLFVFQKILTSLWKSDLEAAESWLFDASRFGDMASVAPPRAVGPAVFDEFPAPAVPQPMEMMGQPTAQAAQPMDPAAESSGAGGQWTVPAGQSPTPEGQVVVPAQPSPAWTTQPAGVAGGATRIPLVHVCYPDGSWYGPYPIVDVVSWSRQGRIPPNVWIQNVEGDGRPRPLSEDLADYPTGPPTLAERLMPRNKAAVLSYYLGIGSFLGVLVCFVPGIIMAIIALVYGTKGLRVAREKPHLRGKAHAIFGMIMAAIYLIIICGGGALWALH